MGRKEGWQYNRLGEWTVVRRYPGTGGDMEAKLYEAFNTRTGAPAVLVAPRRGAAWQVPAPWVARAAGAHGYLAVELVQAPPAQHLDTVSANLARLAQALASVESSPGALQPHPRPWWKVHAAYPLVLAAAAVLALLAPRPVQHSAASVNTTPAQLGPTASVHPAAKAYRTLVQALALPMPTKPFPGQARPNAEGKCEVGERLINGGCWIRLGDLAPPCTDRSYEWKGGCYLPMYPPRREDTSAHQ